MMGMTDARAQDIVRGHPSITLPPHSPPCKGNLTILRRILHLDLAKGNTK
jgi:hypothetical protein